MFKMRSGKFHSVTVFFKSTENVTICSFGPSPLSSQGASVEAGFVVTIVALFPVMGTCLNKEILIRGNDNCDKLPGFHVYLLFSVAAKSV